MRLQPILTSLVLSSLLFSGFAHAQTPLPSTITGTLTVGSTGPQVTLLQKLLNQDSDTRIALTGPGSQGLETTHFGSLTRLAVIRFQEKYRDEILSPSGLSSGNGRVGAYTRAKLNTLSTPPQVSTTISTGTKPDTTPSATPPLIDYAVKSSERVDIYAGDKLIAAVQQKLRSAIDDAIISGGAGGAAMPSIGVNELPRVVIQSLSPQSGLPGDRVTVTGTNVLANSVLYFGPDKIVRTITRDLYGGYSFIIPSIPPKRYDVALSTSGTVSNTVPFIIIDPRNPSVQVTGTSPADIRYGDTVTITGSGFTSTGNTVVTTYQTVSNVPSSDGKTLTIQFTPENLRESAKVGTGETRIPTGLQVINDYGFSNTDKSFTMML